MIHFYLTLVYQYEQLIQTQVEFKHVLFDSILGYSSN